MDVKYWQPKKDPTVRDQARNRHDALAALAGSDQDKLLILLINMLILSTKSCLEWAFWVGNGGFKRKVYCNEGLWLPATFLFAALH